MNSIDLFPLHLVLFPGAFYPLHIFEDRYRKLIARCLEDGSEFGIVLVQGGRLAPVGCSARVEKVLTRHPDGKLDIIVAGGWRFRIERATVRPGELASAKIVELSDVEEGLDRSLLEETIAAYNDLLARLGRDEEDRLDPNDWLEGGASFRMAPRVGMELAERQRILELDSENGRLARVHAHLKMMREELDASEQIDRIARNDGYSSSM